MCLCCLEADYTGGEPEASLELPPGCLCAPLVMGLGVSMLINMATKVELIRKGSFGSKYTNALVPAFVGIMFLCRYLGTS